MNNAKSVMNRARPDATAPARALTPQAGRLSVLSLSNMFNGTSLISHILDCYLCHIYIFERLYTRKCFPFGNCAKLQSNLARFPYGSHP